MQATELLWMMHDFVYGFEYFCVYYFGLTLVFSAVAVSGLLSRLLRNEKIVLTTSVVLLAPYFIYWFLEWQDVEWKLYKLAMGEASSAGHRVVLGGTLVLALVGAIAATVLVWRIWRTGLTTGRTSAWWRYVLVVLAVRLAYEAADFLRSPFSYLSALSLLAIATLLALWPHMQAQQKPGMPDHA